MYLSLQADDETTQQESHEMKLHPPMSAEAGEGDIEPPKAKRLKLSTPALAPKENGEQKQHAEEKNSSKLSSERLKSLSDIPSEMLFETEIPILEKPVTSSTATTSLLSSNEQLQQPSTAQEMEGCSGGSGHVTEKVESLGVFFETAVHNSNLLHVCCQLNESNGGAKAGKATGEEWGEGERERERSGEYEYH